MRNIEVLSIERSLRRFIFAYVRYNDVDLKPQIILFMQQLTNVNPYGALRLLIELRKELMIIKDKDKDIREAIKECLEELKNRGFSKIIEKYNLEELTT